MHDKLATIALDMLAKVSIPADDNTIAAVTAVRNMLRGISTGALIVSEVPKPQSIGDKKK